MEQKVLRGERVVLRPKRLEDAEDDYRWRVDEELSRLDAAPPLRMPLPEFKRLAESELMYAVPWSRRYAVETADEKHIGNCMYYDIDYGKKQAELGILIGERECWGKGYGTEAVRVLLRHIFMETPITKVYLHTLDWNVRAQRSFAKCGFMFVKKIRRDGQWFHYMEVAKEQWLKLEEGRAAEQSPSSAHLSSTWRPSTSSG